jgi:hypothetical protein
MAPGGVVRAAVHEAGREAVHLADHAEGREVATLRFLPRRASVRAAAAVPDERMGR